ncbi:MAG: MBL fold metallo-hydrolase [Aquabacterium sp.]
MTPSAPHAGQAKDAAHSFAAAAGSAPGTPVPRRAASMIVLRDAPQGLEVLMLRRAERPGDQNSGASVFPGGLLDTADAGHGELCNGLDDRAASQRLGIAHGGLDYWIAAVRECFEEAGLLFAVDAQGRPLDLDALPAADVEALRRALHANQTGMAEVCARLGVRLEADALTYYSHWVTPAGLPKIFDTRFFIAALPPGQTARHDQTETVDLMWLTPAQALDKARGLRLLNVTEETLKALGRHRTAAEAIAAARAQAVVPLIRPRLGRGAQDQRTVVNPGEWAYAEVGRLDPAGRGDVRTVLVPGAPVRLSDHVVRITADNGSMMTGPGTNSYFIGAGDDWALLDPGPDDDAHVRALLAAAPGRITRILATHTHKDHSPAALAIRAATGAPLVGRVADYPEWQDGSFQPEHVPQDGEALALGGGITLQAVHTPGHASNHLCWLLPHERLLFTGDHLMQGSTVVINPPDGDMAVYIKSLEKLLALDIDWLAPGHGFLIDDPHGVVRKTVAHRLGREAKVVAALRALGSADEPALLAQVYADTPKALHAMALRSLRAHLLKLRGDGSADADAQGRWALR